MSLFLAKKQEENNQKKVRDLLRLKENKKCFDCPTKSPAFVNTTIQTFVCARCSGLVREVGHRVKAVSASKFSGAELLALKQGGNGVALKIWLSNYSTHDSPEPESDADVRAFMKQKYYENKWLDRAMLQSHKEKVRALLAKSFTEDGLPIVTKSKTKIISGFARVPLIADSEMNIMNDDEEEEESALEPKQKVSEVSSPPEYKQPINFSIPPPTSPIASTGRASMESTHSSHSVKSFSSIHSQSQEEYVSPHRRAVNSGRNSFSSSGRESTDSTRFSTASSSTTSGVSVLTAEEIAERCRVSIDSNSSNPSSAVEETPNCPEPAVAEEKTTPNLQINVAEANKAFNEYHHQQEQPQHPQQLQQPQQQQPQQQQSQQQQPKVTTTLVNYGNSIPSPTTSNGNKIASASPVVTPSTSKALNTPSVFDSIMMDLSGLKLEKTARRATYTGGILSPASIVSPPTPSTSTDGVSSNNESKSRPTSMFDPSVFAKNVASKPLPENDLYAALRGIPSPVVNIPKEEPKKEESKELTFSEDDEDDEDPWQEFCSSSSVDDNEDITTPPAQVIPSTVESSKSMVAIDIFGDLDPRAMFKRF